MDSLAFFVKNNKEKGPGISPSPMPSRRDRLLPSENKKGKLWWAQINLPVEPHDEEQLHAYINKT